MLPITYAKLILLAVGTVPPKLLRHTDLRSWESPSKIAVTVVIRISDNDAHKVNTHHSHYRSLSAFR